MNIPVKEYNERTYPNFLAFTNAVRMATEPLHVSDEELVLCIKNRLVGVDHQIAEIYIEQETKKGRSPSSSEFIGTMNQLVARQGNHTRWVNLRLQQSDVEFSEFKDYATRKFLAISKTQPGREVKSMLSEVALYSLPSISDTLLSQIEEGRIKEFPELLNEGRRLTDSALSGSQLNYDSEVKQRNFVSQPNHGFRNVTNPFFNRNRNCDGYRRYPNCRLGQGNSYGQSLTNRNVDSSEAHRSLPIDLPQNQERPMPPRKILCPAELQF